MKWFFDWFIKWVLIFYLKFLEAGIDPENFDTQLSRRIDAVISVLES
jgi:hypothetical protein